MTYGTFNEIIVGVWVGVGREEVAHTQYICTQVQSNLTIMNPGYNELLDITNIDLRMYTYVFTLCT